jgi:hypothetical protein
MQVSGGNMSDLDKSIGAVFEDFIDEKINMGIGWNSRRIGVVWPLGGELFSTIWPAVPLYLSVYVPGGQYERFSVNQGGAVIA